MSNTGYNPRAPFVIQHIKLEDLMAEWVRGIPLYVTIYKNQKMTAENTAVTIVSVVRWFDNSVIHSYTPYMQVHNYHPFMVNPKEIEQTWDEAEATLKRLTQYLREVCGAEIRQGLVEIGCPPFASERWQPK
jgi:hypothetical protein